MLRVPSFSSNIILGFIDSPCLKSIGISPYQSNLDLDHEPGDLLSPSMSIVASKWSQCLKEVNINSLTGGFTHRNSKFLMPLADLHEIHTFDLEGWRMERNNDTLRHLAMSWPKLGTLTLLSGFISLSDLRTIAENCLQLRILNIKLDVDTIPPFDDISSKSLCHKLAVLIVRGVHRSTTQILSLECQIQIARHLDLFFPYVEDINVWDRGICDLVKLCQDARRGIC